MCYIEYIGYHCGHTSVAVLRMCPLTTHLPTNPVCPRSAHRPTQVTGVCPACARVLHTRWVDLVMFEHQWMHERGTCGCPVQFPRLQEPRAVGPAGAHDHDRDEPARPGRDSALDAISARMGDAVRAMADRAPDGAAQPGDSLQGPSKAWNNLAPLWEVDDSAEVHVRLSSQYAAEWVLDHGKRHRDGDCACPVRFEQYTPHRVTEEDVAAQAKGKPKAKAKKGGQRGRARRKAAETASAATSASHLMSETLRLSDVIAWTVIEQSTSPTRPWSAWPTRPEDYGFKTVTEAENALWGKGPVVPTPSHVASKTVAPAYFHKGENPIVGWPIGAGPENGVENSHSTAWHMCDLSRPRLRRSRSSEW